MVPADYLSECLLQKSYLRGEMIIDSLTSHIGISDDEFEDLLAEGKFSKIRSWYKNLGLRVLIHRNHSITCIDLTRHFLLCNEHTSQDTISLGKIFVLVEFDVQVVAGWRYQVEIIFAWMRDIDLVRSLSRGW